MYAFSSLHNSLLRHALPGGGKDQEEKREVKASVEDDGRKEEETKTGEKGKDREEEVKKEGNEKEEHQLQLFAPINEGIEQQQEDRNEVAQFIEPMGYDRYSRDAYQRLFNLDALRNFVLPHDSGSEDDSSGSEGSVITVEDINDRRSENP
ncbi:hypothetical protein SUGI_0723040 [Cryptomeria japonica]|nr:hypothetical protein SUGI_0723040 [Cryptomeria japonica]